MPSSLAWKVHYDGQGKGIHHAPLIPITAGRDLNALSNALIKQQQDFVKNAASKIIPNGDHAPSAPEATTAPPQANREQAEANVPVPDGAPTVDTNQPNGGQQNGQQIVPPSDQQAQNGQQGAQTAPNGQHNQQNNGFLRQVVSDVAAVPKNAIGTAHDVTHGVVNNLPGGQQASNITHGIADKVIPGGHGLFPGSHGGEAPNGGSGVQNGQQQQQQHGGLLPDPLNAAKQLPGNLFNHGS